MERDWQGEQHEPEKPSRAPIDRVMARMFGADDGEYDIVIPEDEDGYAFAGIRASVGAFDVVVIDWQHPNYGYFSDGMLWIRSFHVPDWQPHPVVNWTTQYGTPQDLLAEFPQFAPLFEDE